jgi:hypothetical protein
MSECILCHKSSDTISAIIDGEYYSGICRSCINSLQPNTRLSAGHQGWMQRRDYEDVADDAVQPYNASGPNPEFYRLYPKQSEKILTKDEIEQVKRKI